MHKNIEEKYVALANARREELSLTKEFFKPTVVNALPLQYPRQIHKLMDTVIQETFVKNGLGYAVNAQGIVLASEIGIPYHHRMFEVLRDTLPDCLTAETFLAGLNCAQRYDSISWLPPDLREADKSWNTAIEIGAFLGHKAVRCAADYMQDSGKYHAIELMEDNFAILNANIVANQFEGVIIPHNVAISNSDGEMEVFSKGRQRSA